MTLLYEAQKKRAEEMLRGSHKMHYPPVDAIIASLSNHELTGIQNWFDLEQVDCHDMYKNEFELERNFTVTKANILEIYETQLQ